MRQEGNASIDACVNNLLAMSRAECPFVRDKGVDPDHIDSINFEEELEDNTKEMLETYEPRIENEGLGITYSQNGDSEITVNISEREVEEEE